MPEVAHLNELHFIVYIFGPELSVLIEGKIEPRLHVPVVVDDGSVLDLVDWDAWVVSQTEHMPVFVQRFSRAVKRDKTRR